MIRLVISDMDGTLIDRDEILTDKAIKIAEELKKKNILFTIATGRAECMASDYVKKMKIQIPYIACNGATIMEGDTVLQRKQIPLKGLRALMEKADSMNMSLVYTADGKESIYRETPWIRRQQKEFNRYFHIHVPTEYEWKHLMIDKLMIMDETREGAIAILEDMCRELPDIYGFTRYTNKSVEVVSRDSTKASALKSVATLLDIPPESILAVGDHQNDIEMLRYSGIGAVVGNATEDAKHAADYVASGRCIDGVQEIVEKFCEITV
ncbi:HAD family hydrolase [Ruminococcus sp. CLA-AA-H200]|uniref:HAD family hydrolase n=1 Tax=Ruminococcus turbiniformis TaxID=2881258 RepID=A0ABS8G1A1_9FIRM|nr:HAD family hydrolase [Ruminococcus turbiniformis]MCC2255373.1 HAD family hydrolase [Ruminococcus turbiniformis]